MLLTLFPIALRAQQRSNLLPDGTAFSLTYNRMTLGDEYTPALSQYTVRLSTLRRNDGSADVGLGVISLDDLSAIAAEAGPAYNNSLPGATLLLRGGLTGIFVATDDAAGGIAGVYAGAAALVRLHDALGFRLDVAHHWYLGVDPNGIGAWTVGGGLAILPRVR